MSYTTPLSARVFVIMLVVFFVVFLVLMIPYTIGLWKVLVKTGRPGWGALVPIYNNYLIIEIVGRPTWWLAMLFIPYASTVFVFLLMLDLAKSFGKSTGWGVGLAFLAPVFMPILGFGSARYLGPSVGAMTNVPTGVTAPAGWYPDPSGAPGVQRYWDGMNWTFHTV